MKKKCEYCNSEMDRQEKKCPTCGAIQTKTEEENPKQDEKTKQEEKQNQEENKPKQEGVKTPKTIEELKKYYEDCNLPPAEITRFFIGIDYKEPRAFGIYKDEKDNFIVYKNKDTGERKIRYEGKDEAHAVNELYLKLKEEIRNQKGRNLSEKEKKKLKKVKIIFTSVFVSLFAFFLVLGWLTPQRGYYNINDNEYYYVNGSWYIYDNYEWQKTTKPNTRGRVQNYYEGIDYDDTSIYPDITTSSVYDESWDTSDSWDDSDSWDSGSTDWGSDW